jgi:hypothetical protein
MKTVFPKTKIEWMQLVLFPFKCYILLFSLFYVVLMVGGGTIHMDKLPLPILLISDQIHLMIVGYALCIIILAVGGIFTAILMRNWKLMRSGLIYAGIGLFLLSQFILPSLAATR